MNVAHIRRSVYVARGLVVEQASPTPAHADDYIRDMQLIVPILTDYIDALLGRVAELETGTRSGIEVVSG